MNLYQQISIHSRRVHCFLLLILEFSTIISNVSAISITSQHQPSEQIIVGRPFKKNDNNQERGHVSYKQQVIGVKEDRHLKSTISMPLNVDETSSSSSFVNSSIKTQPAIGDHSLADDAPFDSDNNDSDTGSFDRLVEPEVIEGK